MGEIDEQFKNIGIDKDAVKSAELVDSGVKQKVSKAEDIEGVQPAQTKIPDMNSMEKMERRMVVLHESMDSFRNQLNEILTQFHGKIETVEKNVMQFKRDVNEKMKEVKAEPAPVAEVKEAEKKGESETKQRDGEYGPGDNDISVEKVFDFSNVKDGKKF